MVYFVINLDKDLDRWRSMSSSFLNAFGFVPERVKGVYAREELSIEELSSLRPSLSFPALHDKEMSVGEMGCFLSHKKCWERFLESKSEWALIMEDDCIFSSSSGRFVVDVNWIPKGVDVCQICSYKEESEDYYVEGISLSVGDGFFLDKLIRPISYGTQAYWINRRAARVALECSKRLIAPVDHFLFDQTGPFCKKVNVRSLTPFVVYQSEEHFCSTLSKERSDKRVYFFARLRKWLSNLIVGFGKLFVYGKKKRNRA